MPGIKHQSRGPALWLLLLAGVLGSVWITGFTPDQLQTWGNAWEFVRQMFPPDWSVLPRIIRAMGETVGIAFLGTFFAFLFAFPISFITARNIGHPLLGALFRVIMAFMRSIPEILWAILFVVVAGFGNVPGVLALAAHNVGILAKLTSEVFEAAPPGPLEAMASTGASKGGVVWYGILPWAMPGIFSHLFFRFECNIRTAALLGVVGAGGIGRELMIHRQLFQYNAMVVDTLGILALVVMADWLGAIVRRQVA